MPDRLRILWAGAGLLLLVFVPAYLLFLACAASATPYMLSYDTLSFAAMAVLMLAVGQGRIMPLLAFFLPLFQLVAGMVGVPGLGLVPIAIAFYLIDPKKIRISIKVPPQPAVMAFVGMHSGGAS